MRDKVRSRPGAAKGIHSWPSQPKLSKMALQESIGNRCTIDCLSSLLPALATRAASSSDRWQALGGGGAKWRYVCAEEQVMLETLEQAKRKQDSEEALDRATEGASIRAHGEAPVNPLLSGAVKKPPSPKQKQQQQQRPPHPSTSLSLRRRPAPH
ncbi:hypothetical protein BKA80DRAFT_34744 [Phyllosticta citrichinensis]